MISIWLKRESISLTSAEVFFRELIRFVSFTCFLLIFSKIMMHCIVLNSSSFRILGYRTAKFQKIHKKRIDRHRLQGKFTLVAWQNIFEKKTHFDCHMRNCAFILKEKRHDKKILIFRFFLREFFYRLSIGDFCFFWAANVSGWSHTFDLHPTRKIHIRIRCGGFDWCMSNFTNCICIWSKSKLDEWQENDPYPLTRLPEYCFLCMARESCL